MNRFSVVIAGGGIAAVEGDRVVESEATTDAAWPVDDKVVAEELPDFLRTLS